MAIFFLSFLCFAEASAFSGTSSFRNDPPASNLAAINALLAAITDMLHLWRQWMWHSAPVLWQKFLLVPMDVNVFTLYGLSDNRWREGCEAHNVSVEPVTNLMYDRSGTTWLSPIGSTGNSQVFSSQNVRPRWLPIHQRFFSKHPALGRDQGHATFITVYVIYCIPTLPGVSPDSNKVST